MAFEFTENLTLYIPDVNKQAKQISESAATGTKKLIIELAAIHDGLTANFNNYPAAALEASLPSWVQPYPKPIILNHDPESEAVGRVMAARMDKEADGLPYIRLQAGITSQSAIEKCLDERYLTGSVGGRAESAQCSICNTEWANSSMFSLPCKHERGKVYNGKLAHLNLGGLSWKEYSLVNIPADQKSTFRNIMLTAPTEDESSDDGWIRPVSIYSMDMNNESIVQLSESDSPRDILSPMKKKEAHYTYLNMKGTFLSITAHDILENNGEKSLNDESDTTITNELGESDMPGTQKSTEENDMSQATEKEVAVEEEEDILAVADQLSADLASNSQENLPDEEEAIVESDETPEEEVPAEDEEVVEETGDAEQLAETEIDSPVEQAETPGEVAQPEESAEAVALKEEVEALKTENAKLRSRLHGMLAERVVDAKIAVGVIESENRASALEDHSKRTASSLGDALRDLAGYTAISPKVTNTPMTLENKSIVTGDADENSEVVADTVITESIEVAPVRMLENILVDGLMNRRKLN